MLIAVAQHSQPSPNKHTLNAISCRYTSHLLYQSCSFASIFDTLIVVTCSLSIFFRLQYLFPFTMEFAEFALMSSSPSYLDSSCVQEVATARLAIISKHLAAYSQTPSHSTSTQSRAMATNTKSSGITSPQRKHKVAIIGSGNWYASPPPQQHQPVQRNTPPAVEAIADNVIGDLP